jgi:hypothetical protein
MLWERVSSFSLFFHVFIFKKREITERKCDAGMLTRDYS